MTRNTNGWWIKTDAVTGLLLWPIGVINGVCVGGLGVPSLLVKNLCRRGKHSIRKNFPAGPVSGVHACLRPLQSIFPSTIYDAFSLITLPGPPADGAGWSGVGCPSRVSHWDREGPGRLLSLVCSLLYPGGRVRCLFGSRQDNGVCNLFKDRWFVTLLLLVPSVLQGCCQTGLCGSVPSVLQGCCQTGWCGSVPSVLQPCCQTVWCGSVFFSVASLLSDWLGSRGRRRDTRVLRIGQ